MVEFEHLFAYSGSIHVCNDLEGWLAPSSDHGASLEGKVWVATDANGMKIKVSESRLDRYIQTDDPRETFFHAR